MVLDWDSFCTIKLLGSECRLSSLCNTENSVLYGSGLVCADVCASVSFVYMLLH